jgi:DNA-binding protein YbaB
MDLKSQLDNYRNLLVQDISDSNELISLQIDGHFKIIQLSIDQTLSTEEIERLMPELFSRAIDSIAEKIRLKLEDLQAAHN